MAWALEKNRGATVKAKKESTLLRLEGDKLRNAVLKGGVGATRFAYTMIKMQAMRLDNMNQQLLKIIGAPTDKKKTTEIDNLRDKVLKGWTF
jgi:CRP-like cAMP-binding protein